MAGILFPVCGFGQTLAHKNWEGSGMVAQAWWARGVFCAAAGGLERAVGEMDALERMGCDAVEVNPGSGYGAAPEMDKLMEAAGRRKMRVVVDLDGGEQEVRSGMMFWGARGAAGFVVSNAGGMGLREAAAGRLVAVTGGRGEGQLRLCRIREADAAGLRAWLSAAVGGRQGAGVLLADSGARLGYTRAAILLLSGGPAQVAVDAVLPGVGPGDGEREFSAEELLLWVPKKIAAADGMVEWLKALSALRRGNASLRAGQAIFLNFDDLSVVGWMIPARDGKSEMVVLCNVGGTTVRVPVAGALRGTGVRGTFLKALVRSDGVVGGGDSLEGVELGAGGVFVGDVR